MPVENDCFNPFLDLSNLNVTTSHCYIDYPKLSVKSMLLVTWTFFNELLMLEVNVVIVSGYV